MFCDDYSAYSPHEARVFDEEYASIALPIRRMDLLHPVFSIVCQRRSQRLEKPAILILSL